MFILQNEKTPPWIETFLLSTTQHVGVGAPTSHILKPKAYLHQRNKDATEVARCVRLNGFLQRLLVGCEAWVHGYAVMQSILDSVNEARVRFWGLTGLIRRVHGLYFCVASGHEDLNEGMLVGPRTLFAQRHTKTETNRCCRIGSNRQWNCCSLTDWVELSFAVAWSTARSNITLHNFNNNNNTK